MGLRLLAALFFALLASQARAADYFESCSNPNASYTTIPFAGPDFNPTFRPECAPDTLYFWAHGSKVWWDDFPTDPIPRITFAFRTPLATFGYGDTQVRLKLKPGVRFRWIRYDERKCDLFSEEERDSTVFVAHLYWLRASEYVVCSKKVLESWSSMTAGAALEARNELARLEESLAAGGNQLYDSFRMPHRRARYVGEEGMNPFFNWVGDAGNDWSEAAFRRNVARLARGEDEDGRGRVYYSRGVSRDPARHFTSALESYFRLSVRQVRCAVQALKDPEAPAPDCPR